MGTLNEIRLRIAEILGIVIVDNKFIFLNLWSVIHFLAGFFIIIFLSLFMKGILTRLIALFGLLILWEIFEFINYGVLGTNLFVGETLIDVITDLWIGMIGGVIGLIVFEVVRINIQ